MNNIPRIERVDVGDYIYHVINRANARVQIFDKRQKKESPLRPEGETATLKIGSIEGYGAQRLPLESE